MPLAELLDLVGVGGGIALAVSAAVALYHLRSLMQSAAKVRTWVWATGVFAFILALGEAGLVPGLDPQPTKFFTWAGGLAKVGVEFLLEEIIGRWL